ncbi:hypothetical protein ACQKMD_01310 [Viridibacillus sp. NPDC096237]|uniref:hypothetical protein n=1 Tax=Viridibacillus sp. NPDC096237 TaxID=3390721 RepID=UPI003D06AC99
MEIGQCCICKESVMECTNWGITLERGFYHMECGKQDNDRIKLRNLEIKENAAWLKDHNLKINEQLKQEDKL